MAAKVKGFLVPLLARVRAIDDEGRTSLFVLFMKILVFNYQIDPEKLRLRHFIGVRPQSVWEEPRFFHALVWRAWELCKI